MTVSRSVEFFDRQFERQAAGPSPGLNPFEQAALPHLRGHVLDYGCGLGELAVAAARAGCTVHALDASEVAVNHLRRLAEAKGLSIKAEAADLRSHRIEGEFDTIVSIGLLMFFDCAAAERALAELEAHLKPGGTLALNVLVQGTTYMEMFDPTGYCLFDADALMRRFADWDVVMSERRDFPAPGGLTKSFATVIARRPSRSSSLARSTGLSG